MPKPIRFQARTWRKAGHRVEDAADQWDRGTRELRQRVLEQGKKPEPQPDASYIDNAILTSAWDLDFQWYQLVGSMDECLHVERTLMAETGDAYDRSEDEAEESARYWRI